MLNISWVEKFRPKNLDDIISQEEIISSLKIQLKIKISHIYYFLDHLDVVKHLLY